jgi:hypothetical protein
MRAQGISVYALICCQIYTNELPWPSYIKGLPSTSIWCLNIELSGLKSKRHVDWNLRSAQEIFYRYLVVERLGILISDF